MKIEYVPTLHVQRELYEKPRDFARFRWYIEQLTGGDTSDARDVQLPIGAVNPMGKAHCLEAVNALIAIDADAVAAAAAGQAAAQLPPLDATARVYLNVLDDLLGGWTDRIFTEFKYRYPDAAAVHSNAKRCFYGVWCWTSQTYIVEDIRRCAFDSVYRGWHTQVHPAPKSLRDMLVLDHNAARFSGLVAPALPTDDLEYTRIVLQPHLDAVDQPTCIAALFGDEAAHSCGYPPLGLSRRAGQALAAQHRVT
jgi:hypothetical protein